MKRNSIGEMESIRDGLKADGLESRGAGVDETLVMEEKALEDTRPRSSSDTHGRLQSKQTGFSLQKGIYEPKTKEESLVSELQAEVTKLKSMLELERARRFHEVEETKMLKHKEDLSTNEEMAQLSRKLNEDRVKYRQEMDTVKERTISEINDQIAKRKGPFYDRLNEEMMATLQGQLNQSKGELYERVMIAAKSAVERECALKQGKVYKAVRAMTEKEIMDEVSLRKGDIYAQLEPSIRADVMKELFDEQQKEQIRIESLERELHTKYTNALSEMREKMRVEHDTMRAELEAELIRQKAAFTDSYAHDIDALSSEWVEKWAARETKWVEDMQSLEETRNKEKAKLVEALEVKTSQSIESLIEQAKTSSENVLNLLSAELNKFKTSEEERIGDFEQIIASGIAKIDQALQSHQVQVARIQKSEVELYEKQVSSLQEVVASERDSFHKSLTAMKKLHDDERENMQQLIKSEQDRLRAEKEHFERELRDQYAIVIKSLKSQHEEERNALHQEKVRLITDEASMEEFKMKITSEAARQAQDDSDKTWKELFQKHKEQWKEDELVRRRDLQTQLEERYSLLISQLEDKLISMQDLQRFENDTWAEKHCKLMEDFQTRENRFKLVCKAVFEKRMDKYVEECDNRFKNIHAEVLRQSALQAEQRCSFESQVQTMKIEMEREKSAYAKRLQAEMAEKLVDLEQKHTKLVEQLLNELQEARGEITALQHAHQSNDHKTLCERITEKNELFQLRMERNRDRQKVEAGERVLRQHRERILELWTTLKLSPVEYVPFLLSVFRLAQFNPKLEKLFESQVHALSAKVPIIRLAYQRELLKEALRKFNTTHGNDRSPEIQIRRDVLMTEFGKLTSEVKQEMAHFFQLYSGEIITYEGRDYNRVVEQDERFSCFDCTSAPVALRNDNVLTKQHEDIEFEL